MTRIAIVGGGPGGYEAALVAAQLDAEVTLIERDAVGGACVVADCVPSKTLIATSEALTVGSDVGAGDCATLVDLPRVNQRVLSLAHTQSEDIAARVAAEGVRILSGSACLRGAGVLEVERDGDVLERLEADVVLLATGARPRVLPTAVPDGERILTWHQLYGLDVLPERLVVVGSGVTGAEFAGAYQALGCDVTLVSSRDRVLPGEDPDAAAVVEDVFRRRGMTVVNRARAAGVERDGDGVRVTLTDGRVVEGSHCLMAVGSEPNTAGIGLEDVGVRLTEAGFVDVDRVSRTSVPGVYAAGDCTGVLMLASVAAMQGRIAMWHALGEAVAPLRLSTVAATVFTVPEIAAVGVAPRLVDSGEVAGRVVTVPLARNPRAKMHGAVDGFVKLVAAHGSGAVLGGVVVAPRASELILSVSLAVHSGLTVDQIAHTFSIYPSLSGSITEAARQLMEHDLD